MRIIRRHRVVVVLATLLAPSLAVAQAHGPGGFGPGGPGGFTPGHGFGSPHQGVGVNA